MISLLAFAFALVALMSSSQVDTNTVTSTIATISLLPEIIMLQSTVCSRHAEAIKAFDSIALKNKPIVLTSILKFQRETLGPAVAKEIQQAVESASATVAKNLLDSTNRSKFKSVLVYLQAESLFLNATTVFDPCACITDLIAIVSSFTDQVAADPAQRWLIYVWIMIEKTVRKQARFSTLLT
jgi:hypothetical protein